MIFSKTWGGDYYSISKRKKKVTLLAFPPLVFPTFRIVLIYASGPVERGIYDKGIRIKY